MSRQIVLVGRAVGAPTAERTLADLAARPRTARPLRDENNNPAEEPPMATTPEGI